MADIPFVDDTQAQQLLANGRQTAAGADLDPCPVVRLFAPGAAAVWLLTELDPRQPDLAFGLCDLGLGFPELGYVSLAEIAAIPARLGVAVEVDRSFVAAGPLSAYAEAARRAGQIVDLPQAAAEPRS